MIFQNIYFTLSCVKKCSVCPVNEKQIHLLGKKANLYIYITRCNTIYLSEVNCGKHIIKVKFSIWNYLFGWSFDYENFLCIQKEVRKSRTLRVGKCEKVKATLICVTAQAFTFHIQTSSLFLKSLLTIAQRTLRPDTPANLFCLFCQRFLLMLKAK